MTIGRRRPGRGLIGGQTHELSRVEREIEDLFGGFFRDWPLFHLFCKWLGVVPAVDRRGEDRAAPWPRS